MAVITTVDNPAPLERSHYNGLVTEVNDKVNKSGTKVLSDNNYDNAAVTAVGTIASKEPALGNPSSNGMVLASTAAGARSWVSVASSYQSEVLTYAGLHSAVGSMVDARSLGSLDRLVVGMKDAGIFTKAKDFMPLLGTNLAGAMLKVVGPAATYTGFVETDFTLTGGLESGTAAAVNSTKYVDLGVDATALGVSYNNLSLVVGLAGGGAGSRTTGSGAVSFGPLLGNYDASAAASLAYLHGNGGSALGGVPLIFPISYIMGVSSTAPGVAYFRNGVQQSTATAATNTAAIPGNFNLFRGRLSSTTFYHSERIGISMILTGLTDAESKTLQLLILQYLIELGRYPLKPNLVAFGDSITAGTGANATAHTSWAALLARELSYNNLNTGVGTSQFRQTATTYTGGFARYTDLYALPADLITIMYGTNDIGSDANASGDSTIIADLSSKLTTVITNYQARNFRVVLLSPPWRSSANDTKMTAYVISQANVAVARGIPFVDTYNIFLDTLGSGSITTNYFPDNLHPNDAGHRLIMEHVRAALQGRIYRDVPLDFPSIAADGSATLTVTMYTARTNHTVEVTTPAAVASAGLVQTAWVSANDTVTIRLYNPTGSAIDAASAIFKTTVFLQ